MADIYRRTNDTCPQCKAKGVCSDLVFPEGETPAKLTYKRHNQPDGKPCNVTTLPASKWPRGATKTVRLWVKDEAKRKAKR